MRGKEGNAPRSMHNAPCTTHPIRSLTPHAATRQAPPHALPSGLKQSLALNATGNNGSPTNTVTEFDGALHFQLSFFITAYQHTYYERFALHHQQPESETQPNRNHGTAIPDTPSIALYLIPRLRPHRTDRVRTATLPSVQPAPLSCCCRPRDCQPPIRARARHGITIPLSH